MKRLLYVFGKKQLFAFLLIILLGFMTVVVTAIYFEGWIALLISALSAVVFGFILLVMMALKGLWDSKQQSQELRSLADQLEALVSKNDRNIRRIHKVTMDTAGSVGRAAPIIRALDARTSSLLSEPRALSAGNPGLSSLATNLESQERSLSFPPIAPRPTEPRIKRNVMVIADEFTASAFASEWQQIQPTPENWREVLETTKIDLLLLESAWEGNDGSWKYHLVGPTAPRTPLIELIKECKQRRIPVVFWNKEDPPHFEDFLPVAKLADYVFTTEGSLIPKYNDLLGHSNVGVLAFAAQPTMHNPVRVDSITRDKEIAFGGTYFRHKYPERKQQLDFLLPAAGKFNLDIFSRLHNNDEKYQFPQPYNRLVRGSLSYQEMIGAYHAYKVIINVNSVVDSTTMCARRIFEATASGAAVVSAPSPAIETYFPKDLITVVHDKEHAYHKIRALLRSDEHRDRLVHRAQRHVWENHTYRHRAMKIMETLDLERHQRAPSVSVIVTTNRPTSVAYSVQNILRQDYKNIEVVFLSHGFELDGEEIAPLEAQGIPVSSLSAPADWPLGKNLNKLVSTAEGDIVLRMDDDDWYGSRYIRDAVNALEYSGAELTGKAASYIYFEKANATILTYAAHEHRYTDFVRGATFTAPREILERYKFPEIGSAEDSGVLSLLKADGARIYSADRFNFVVNRWEDKSRHTWGVDDDQLFATGRLEFIGNGQEQVDV